MRDSEGYGAVGRSIRRSKIARQMEDTGEEHGKTEIRGTAQTV